MKTLKITVAVAAVSLSLYAMGGADDTVQTFYLYNNTGVTMTLNTLAPALQCLQAAVSPSPIPSGSMAVITVGGGSTEDFNRCEMTFDIPLSPSAKYQLNIAYGVTPSNCNGAPAVGCTVIYSPETTLRVSGSLSGPAFPIKAIPAEDQWPFPAALPYSYNAYPYTIQIKAQP